MNSTPLIVASELNERLGDPGLSILDCRFDLLQPTAGRDDWLVSHIPGAAYADLDCDLAGPITARSGRHPLPEASALCDVLGRLGVGTGNSVVVYDSGSGAIAARAWWLLLWLGHEDVCLLDGGFAAWQAGGFATEKGATSVPQRVFAGAPREELVLSTEEVVAAIPVARNAIFDARDSARYRGEVEPIDAVAGHIPGTRNLPFANSMSENGHWKSPSELRQTWSESAGESAEDERAVMCGSGVTGCHLALSARLAGLPMPRLYVGSWSEWIADPSRPVATGDQEPDFAGNDAEPA